MRWKVLLPLAAVAGVGAFAFLNPGARSRIEGAVSSFSHAGKAEAGGPTKDRERPAPEAPEEPWDGLVHLEDAQRQALGLACVPVKAQTEPSHLRLGGSTDYDPFTLTVIRPPFNGRVQKVYVRQGDAVKKGDPLVDLFSNSLAEAKSDFENRYTQWLHDKELVDKKRDLAAKAAIARRELIEAENDERKSQVQMKLAKDELLVYGLTDKEIEDARNEVGAQKARMTIRSPADGFVIKQEVAPGNIYEPNSPLLVISPVDHLWVRGNVNEIDADKVQPDQGLEVVFPYTDTHVAGRKVEYIDRSIDPDTHAAKFRTSVPNAGGTIKAGQFVRVILDIPPLPGRTVIPRAAMISIDRDNYAFVRKPGPGHVYERRPIRPWQEGDDEVIVAEPSATLSGLAAGEEVVTVGGLLLEQIYEDKALTATGSPP